MSDEGWWSWRVRVRLRSLVQSIHYCKPVCIGMFSCGLPLATLTLAGRYPINHDQYKSPILQSGFYIGGAGGYRPRVRRMFSRNTTGLVYFSCLSTRV